MTLACLSAARGSKTRPKIIVSMVGSTDGFRDTDLRCHPAGHTFWFR
jgi:hypothetical protein